MENGQIQVTTDSEITPNSLIAFVSAESKMIGRLWLEDNALKFEGDVEESAKQFFEKVCSLWGESTTKTNPAST